MKPAAPIFDGTADTFDCDLCGNAHPRSLPDEDGILGGQGRTPESLWRDGYVAFAVGIVFLSLVLGAALWLAFR